MALTIPVKDNFESTQLLGGGGGGGGPTFGQKIAKYIAGALTVHAHILPTYSAECAMGTLLWCSSYATTETWWKVACAYLAFLGNTFVFFWIIKCNLEW